VWDNPPDGMIRPQAVGPSSQTTARSTPSWSAVQLHKPEQGIDLPGQQTEDKGPVKLHERQTEDESEVGRIIKRQRTWRTGSRTVKDSPRWYGLHTKTFSYSTPTLKTIPIITCQTRRQPFPQHRYAE
jgi:hypothetical protein